MNKIYQTVVSAEKRRDAELKPLSMTAKRKPLSKTSKHKQGFTLTELLLVVLIIGILAAAALPKYRVAVAKTRYMQLVTAATAIWRAEKQYYLANGSYTADIRDLDISISGCVTNENGHGCKSGRYACFVYDGTNDAAGNPSIYPYCGTGQRSEFLAFFYHLNGGRSCFAAVGSAVNNAVCKSFGGRFLSNTGAYNVYSMP